MTKKFILITVCLLLLSCSAESNAPADSLADLENVPDTNEYCRELQQRNSGKNIIITVRGPIQPEAFGKALVHEHVMADFIGAAETGRHRYNPDVVVETMLPFLQAVRQRGFTGFVDCTPAWLGRDVEILFRLSELTGLHILTNTGYYGAADDKFLPSYAFTETAEQLAVRWVREFEKGIDGTNIKPGFIKTGLDPGPLSTIDRKLVQAAAKTHLKTGLTIGLSCHRSKSGLGCAGDCTQRRS